MEDRARPTHGGSASLSRQIGALALPAFASLIAEPLFLLIDSAIVGHLGVDQLAALGVAGAVLSTVVGLAIFLAYGTTAAVARRVGAGDPTGAARFGVDGCWLALAVGAVAVAVLEPAASLLVKAFHAPPDVAVLATGYLRIAAVGLPALLVGMAVTGMLRGFADTRTPLAVAVGMQTVNAVLNLILVYGLWAFPGLGLPGSAVGTAIAQWLAGLTFVVVMVRAARRGGTSLAPDLPGLVQAAQASAPLIVRTLTLRVALLLTVVVAAAVSPAALAAHQVAANVWGLLALALDAIAIAAQTLAGQALGAGDPLGVRALTRLMTWWGAGAGVVLGLLLLAGHRLLPALFSSDPAVRALLASVLLVQACWQPVNGVVFVLDGVLIGAGDARYLALAGVVTLAVFAPLALVVWHTHAGLTWLWWSFGAFMAARFVTLVLRAQGTAWMRLGAR
jgi:putative MATE family efflux protein